MKYDQKILSEVLSEWFRGWRNKMTEGKKMQKKMFAKFLGMSERDVRHLIGGNVKSKTPRWRIDHVSLILEKTGMTLPQFFKMIDQEYRTKVQSKGHEKRIKKVVDLF